MTDISTDRELVRKVHAEIGTAELARLAELPYTTVNDCQGRDFKSKPLETFEKLVLAARKHEDGKGEDAADQAAA